MPPTFIEFQLDAAGKSVDIGAQSKPNDIQLLKQGEKKKNGILHLNVGFPLCGHEIEN